VTSGADAIERRDPIRFEVLRNALTAISDEMALAVQRAAYSTNVKTRLDFSCAVLDLSARVIAQSFSQPNHLASLVYFVPRILSEYGRDRLRPGDGILCNDGHRGGVHLNDVCLVVPIFVDEKIIGFAAIMCHHVDVGGGTPGSIGLSREIFQEGVIIPPVQFLQNGQICDDVFKLILNNVRSPRETGGDLRAQVAGVNIAIRRLTEMVEKHGLSTVTDAMDGLLDYTERRTRAALTNIPHGVYEAVGYMDSDGFNDTPVKIQVKITVTSEKVLYDLTGSDAQVKGPINATYAMTFSDCAYTLLVLMDSDLPVNDGFYRVIELVAPVGSVVNAQHPAAIGAGWETAFRVCETSFRAFAHAVPERLSAGSKGCLCNIGFGGIDPRTGSYFAFYEAMAGGYGARFLKDGIDAIQPHVQNTENSPVEETEASYPMRIVRYELIPDSDGAGRHRGGLGLRRDYTFEGEVVFSVLADAAKFAPWGLAGGLTAHAARFVRNPDTQPREYGSKLTVDLQPGEVFSVRMGGGGGYGPPWERDPSLVLEDVAGGKVSVERGQDIYGVVLDAASKTVDQDATEARRRVMRDRWADAQPSER
jgi:N-methylhydantoinase B